MLVLTLKQDERLFIGNNVSVMVVESSTPIRLGINAPADVRVDREAVRLSKQADAAASPGAPSSAAELLQQQGEPSFNN